MARLRAALLLALALGAGAPAAVAEEPKRATDARAEIRARIQEMVRSLQSLRMGGSLPRQVPAFTEQANGLLASPPEDLRAVLASMTAVPAGDDDDWTDNLARVVAALLLGVGPTANRRFEGEQFVEMHGFALVVSIGEDSYNQHTVLPDPPDLPLGPGAAFRRPFRPRPFDLLKEILASSERVRGLGERMMARDEFLQSAGVELGDAARRDPEFAKFLLAVCAEPREDKVAEPILVAALGRWAGPGAVDELKRRLAAAVKTEDRGDWYQKVSSVAKALTDAGADAALAELALKGVGGGADEKQADLARLAGGAAVSQALLDRVRESPTPEHLGALANALNDPMEPKEPLDLRLAAFEEARRVRAESKDPSVRAWCYAVLQNSLWAGLYWRFGFMQGKNFPEDADRDAALPNGSKPENERDYFLGAWPDPVAQGAALKADFAAGRFRHDAKWGRQHGGEGSGKAIEIWPDRAAEKDPGVDLAGRYEYGKVVLTVKNRRETPIAVNPLAPSYAVAMMVPLKGEPKGRVELDLQPGRVLPGYRLLVPASAMKVIAPGDSHEMSFACGPLASGSRVLLSYRDEFEVDGELAVPVLRSIWELRIDVP